MEQPKYYDTIKELILSTSALYKDDVAFRVKTKAGKNPEYKDYTYADFIENVNAVGTVFYVISITGSFLIWHVCSEASYPFRSIRSSR